MKLPFVTARVDNTFDFPVYSVQGGTKAEQRQYIAEYAISWLMLQKKRGVYGAIMIDIDDTILDGRQMVQNGFELMKTLFDVAGCFFPIHIVTARPDSEKDYVIRMLQERGFTIPFDRLHLLPEAWYGKGDEFVERYKWDMFTRIANMHNGCVARFGDRLWDVAHIDALHTYMKDVSNRSCYIFKDRRLRGTLSFKLPG
jgi:hypothetical protein